MGSEWKAMKLGDVGEFRNGVNFNRSQEGSGIPIVKVKDFGEAFWVPDSGLDELNPKEIYIPDSLMLDLGDTIIIRSNGNIELVGRSLYFNGSSKPVTFSGFCIRFRPNNERIFPRFAAYFIRSPYCRQRFSSYGSGTGIQNLNQDILSQVPLLLPPLPEQRAIAQILGSLDDKIELNRRMNTTLEEMARAIFQSWFVDFDPVRAKAAGRASAGLDAATAALFPDAFEVVDGREVPRGWELSSLDQIATYLNGLALQKFPPEGDDFLPVIKIAQMRKGHTRDSDKASINIPSQYVVHDGDVLFSWSGSLEVVIWCGGRGALNQHLFKVSSELYPKWFYYLWTRHHLPEFQFIAASKVTTMGHIQRHHLTQASVVVPSSGVLLVADQILSPLIDQIIEINLQSRTLIELRDALLPRLISGELRVRDVEHLVEDKL